MYGGLFLVSLATLMYEMLLTRVFSATLWYHFGFLVVSLAMFGITFGALLVYLNPARYPEDATKSALAGNSIILSLFMLISFLVYLFIPVLPFMPDLPVVASASVAALLVVYILFTVPFVFFGVTTCLALTRFPDSVSRLYAADLIGGALGCLALVVVLSLVDAPTAVIITSALAAFGGLCFALEQASAKLRQVAFVVGVLLLIGAAVQGTLFATGQPSLHLTWYKGMRMGEKLYEKWNPFSYVCVFPFYEKGTVLMSTLGQKEMTPEEGKRDPDRLYLQIDSSAGTTLTKFPEKLDDLEYMNYDVANVVQSLRPNADVLIIGAGGGKDVLGSLYFKQKSITAVDINDAVIEADNRVFGDFTGHLDRLPNVRFVRDEARSFVSRSDKKYDIIMASLIDTWAATSAGAFTLTENSLYTVEAWKEFISHLNDGGMVAFTRNYGPRWGPNEVYRLTAVAVEALKELGVKEPRQHILVVSKQKESPNTEAELATIIVGKSPVTEEQINQTWQIAKKRDFEVLLTPRHARVGYLSSICQPDNKQVLESSPFDVSPSTDDRPFFFNMVRLKDAAAIAVWAQGRLGSPNNAAVSVLLWLLISLTALTAASIIVPLKMKAGAVDLKSAWPQLAFFAAIGAGFMLAEVAQMQRLTIFLGHPVYAVAVVLSTLLVASGIGSFLTAGLDASDARAAVKRLMLIVAALVVSDVLSIVAKETLIGAPTVVRIVTAIGVLFPMGLFMGMAFPIGIKAAARLNAQDLTPWFWGINGATSVLASVLAVAISMSAGIHVTFIAAIGVYVIAVLSHMRAVKESRCPSPASPSSAGANPASGEATTCSAEAKTCSADLTPDTKPGSGDGALG